ncbi:hypothetical protein [Enemella dayhoffiae]|uniref:hypothetical protein n=1 Tax=Enemella dayhoffiae TaxID=2016507 RepID=UPI0011408871|nr:hypothetical protein [Enemella dayhoffiae]
MHSSPILGTAGLALVLLGLSGCGGGGGPVSPSTGPAPSPPPSPSPTVTPVKPSAPAAGAWQPAYATGPIATAMKADGVECFEVTRSPTFVGCYRSPIEGGSGELELRYVLDESGALRRAALEVDASSGGTTDAVFAKSLALVAQATGPEAAKITDASQALAVNGEQEVATGWGIVKLEHPSEYSRDATAMAYGVVPVPERGSFTNPGPTIGGPLVPLGWTCSPQPGRFECTSGAAKIKAFPASGSGVTSFECHLGKVDKNSPTFKACEAALVALAGDRADRFRAALEFAVDGRERKFIPVDGLNLSVSKTTVVIDRLELP